MSMHTQMTSLSATLLSLKVVGLSDKWLNNTCVHAHKDKHKIAHFPFSISGIPQHLGKTLCCPKKLMHNRPLSLSLSPSLSPFGLVKPSQIKSAFHQAFCNWCFCYKERWFRGLSELVFQLDRILAAAWFLLSAAVFCRWVDCVKTPCWN